MNNVTLYPHYVAVAVKVNNPKLAELRTVNRDIIPVSVLVIEKGNDVYELPSARLQPTDKSLVDCAKRAVLPYLGEDWDKENAHEPFREIKTYLVPDQGVHGYIVTDTIVDTDIKSSEECYADIERCMQAAGLNSIQREVFIAKHEGKTAEDAAKELGISRANYDTILSRTRKLMKACYMQIL